MDFGTESRAREVEPMSDELDELLSAWTGSGARLLHEIRHLNHGTCAVALCNFMTFVGLKTDNGARPICLKHFQALRTAARHG